MSSAVADRVASSQELVTDVTDLVQSVIPALAGAVGNFVCVARLVTLGCGAAGLRRAIVGAPGPSRSPSRRMRKFQRAFARYGVPGVGLLGPLLLPTHVTATALVASGCPGAPSCSGRPWPSRSGPRSSP